MTRLKDGRRKGWHVPGRIDKVKVGRVVCGRMASSCTNGWPHGRMVNTREGRDANGKMDSLKGGWVSVRKDVIAGKPIIPTLCA